MRPLRQFLPDRAYLITARCFEERFFLAPDSEALNLIVASSLAQAAAKFHLDLFAFVVMSNHLHLVVRAPHGGLPEAMQLFFSQVARRVNVLRNRVGPVFADRYHHQTICDEQALQNAVRYVLLNPQRAGISRSAASWEGLTSYADTCEGRIIECIRERRGRAVLWTRAASAPSMQPRTPPPPIESTEAANVTRFSLRCHPATLMKGADGLASHRKFVASLAAEVVELENVRVPVEPHERPARPKRSRAPSCIASTSAAREDYAAERRAFIAAYRTASARFRRGEAATFPPGCCLPWPQLYSLISSCSDTSPNLTKSS